MKNLVLSFAGILSCAAQGAVFQERPVIRAAGPWEMSVASNPGEWMPAKVPGTVLTTLVLNGKVPDPYYGLNNKISRRAIVDLGEDRTRYEATFRSTVVLPHTFVGKTVWMRPEGINYRGEIFLNGKLAAVTSGMFARNAVDVTSFVKSGETNELVVKVHPVDHPGTPRKKAWGAANNEWCNGGDGELGRDVTMLMSAGWDFTFNDGIRDRNTGIWRPIEFFASDDVRLDAPYVRTKLDAAFSEVELEFEIDLHNSANGADSERAGVLRWSVEGTGIRAEKRISLFRGERRTERIKATLKAPRLWWPRNKGPQNLYQATAEFVVDGTDGKASAVSDRVEVRFGIREVYSDQSGPDGARQFYVNGRRVFIRGTNWIPEAMLKADDARMEREVGLSAESGVNLLRLWAGGIIESDYFYQLCDELGLMVWQEFWMTGDTRHPDDQQLYLANVADSLRRIRAHACLVHYVASNESTEVAGTEGLVRRMTGTKSWMMQSECDGVHDGSPYFPVNPMRYYEDTASERGSRVCGFNPEFGTCALPCAEQLRTFMPEELLWPVERNVEAWKYREGGGFDRMTEFHHQYVNCYGRSSSIDEYARKSQAADALAHRALWETWNRARNHATGVLFWYNNTPIPQIGSHAWDYDLDQTASFFAQKNALEPVHAQYEYLSNRVSVVNDLTVDKRVRLEAAVYDFNSRKVWEREEDAVAVADRCIDLFEIPFGKDDGLRSMVEPHFIKLRLFEDGREIASTFYWRSCEKYEGAQTVTGPCVSGFERLSRLPETRLSVVKTTRGLRIENTGDRIAFMVRVSGWDRDGRYVVPVHYSDNYFSLLPGESEEVDVEAPGETGFKVKAWNSDSVEIGR